MTDPLRRAPNGLAYRVDGAADGDWLVLSNSLLTDHRLWDRLVDGFAGRFRILRYDQRGHGRTPPAAADCSFGSLTADLLGVLDHVGIERANLVGISMGGNTVARLAAKHPHRVAAVALCDCRPASDDGALAAWRERVDRARNGHLRDVVEDTLARWFPGDDDAATANRAFVRTMAECVEPAGYRSAVAAIAGHDSRSWWQRIAAPVLLVTGDRDGTLPSDYPAVAASMRHAQTAVIPGAGHLSVLDAPRAFAAALESFLEQVLPAGAGPA